MNKQGNTILPQVHDSPATDPKDTERKYHKKFKRMTRKVINEFQENTNII